MSHARRAAPPMTVEEFLTWADRQPGKWELVDGWPRAMAPASTTHGAIQARAASLLDRHIEATGSPCRAVTEAAIVPSSFKRHNARGAELAITCSPASEDEWALKDPVFILEILPPSNEQDTRDNVWVYMTMPSVRQILLLASTAVRGRRAVPAPGRRGLAGGGAKPRGGGRGARRADRLRVPFGGVLRPDRPGPVLMRRGEHPRRWGPKRS